MTDRADDAASAETLPAPPADARETRASEPAARGDRIALPPGTRVGRYELIEKIGAGGMGLVYRARDPRLDRDVAVKFVATSGEVAAAQQRLEREAQAMAKLSHPNVAAVYDIGTYRDQIFVAMELCPGGSLGAWLRERRPWREVVRRFLAAGRGLAAAHRVGLVHRDFKPDNVLVGTDDAVKVCDFGLVTSSADVARGRIEGTPVYMAPEQLAGDSVDARADQFAFAVSVWEGICGGRPFHPDVDSTDPLENQLRAIRARHRMRATRIDAPARVLRVLERALEPDPDARWPSVDAMLRALERAARPRWPRYAIAATLVAIAAAAIVVEPRLRRPAKLDAATIHAIVHPDASALARIGDVAVRRHDLRLASDYYYTAYLVDHDPSHLLALGIVMQHETIRAALAHEPMRDIQERCRATARTYSMMWQDLHIAPPPETLQFWRDCEDPIALSFSADQLDLVATELARDNRYDDAKRALEKALDITDDPRFLRALGDLDVEFVQCDAARWAYDEYIKREPRLTAGARAAVLAGLTHCKAN